ncbi:diaminopimelate epimerase (macronuclear) [Tetrahymena thermophila SB210]|uniref:Diaminopimelate epimerase n=1 Tax=Tetrahymena thermophila (strain SB210) TaxID=312017 RepID=I7MJ90_TETTS|nr:diaminopimelate epimerase [Tetrahymena thermophila SB210]EAR96078.1 diaminopimelate epimerase [Tetrahymena thermophila SB210]|eukprot:XP_001016323.1 diaminopimelate epimerase [Tetrahymena thermophila SB210]
MILHFDKFHGLGNDFIIIDNRQNLLNTCGNPDEFSKIIAKLCDRHLGIGADGVMFVENESEKDKQDGIQADIRYKIFNADGYESQICGNGLRCFTRYILEKKIIQNKKIVQIRTNIGVLECEELSLGLYRTNIGKATAEISKIPANPFNSDAESVVINQPLKINQNLHQQNLSHLSEETHYVTFVNVGNPHCVIYVDDVETAEVERIGKTLQSRKDIFPQSVNVEFIQILDENTLKMRVYERGCGETMACGTGACASVFAGILNKKNSPSSKVLLRGGELQINVNQEDYSLQVIGPAAKVFEGSIQFPLN